MHAVLGEEPKLEVKGVWIFRGKGIPQEMKDHPQFEYYKLKELSIDNEEDKKLIGDFLTLKEGDVIDGKKVQECKMHKWEFIIYF